MKNAWGHDVIDEAPPEPPKPEPQLNAWGHPVVEEEEAPEEVELPFNSNLRSHALGEALRKSGLYNSATAAMGSRKLFSPEVGNKIYRGDDGEWVTPPIARNKEGFLDSPLSAIAGAGALVQQKFGMTGATREDDDPLVQQTLNDFQAANGLTDEQVKAAWDDLSAQNRSWGEKEDTRILADGSILPNPSSKAWLTEQGADKAIGESGAKMADQAQMRARIPKLMTQVAAQKMEAYAGAAAAVDFLPSMKVLRAGTKKLNDGEDVFMSPHEWALENNRMKDFGTPQFVADYEKEVIDKQDGLSEFVWGLGASATKGNMQLASWISGMAGSGLSLAGDLTGSSTLKGASKSLDQVNMDLAEAQQLTTEGAPDAGIAGRILEQAPSLMAQIAISRGLGAGAGVLTKSQIAARRIAAAGAVIAAGSQSLGSQYGQSLLEGSTPEEARKKAFRAGLSTSVITGIFQTAGMGGVEKVAAGRPLAEVTVGDLMKSSSMKVLMPKLKSFAGDVLKASAGEGAEEGIDQLVQAFITADPDTNLADAWSQAEQAAGIGFFIGGLVDIGSKAMEEADPAQLVTFDAYGNPVRKKPAMGQSRRDGVTIIDVGGQYDEASGLLMDNQFLANEAQQLSQQGLNQTAQALIGVGVANPQGTMDGLEPPPEDANAPTPEGNSAMPVTGSQMAEKVWGAPPGGLTYNPKLDKDSFSLETIPGTGDKLVTFRPQKGMPAQPTNRILKANGTYEDLPEHIANDLKEHFRIDSLHNGQGLLVKKEEASMAPKAEGKVDDLPEDDDDIDLSPPSDSTPEVPETPPEVPPSKPEVPENEPEVPETPPEVPEAPESPPVASTQEEAEIPEEASTPEASPEANAPPAFLSEPANEAIRNAGKITTVVPGTQVATSEAGARYNPATGNIEVAPNAHAGRLADVEIPRAAVQALVHKSQADGQVIADNVDPDSTAMIAIEEAFPDASPADRGLMLAAAALNGDADARNAIKTSSEAFAELRKAASGVAEHGQSGDMGLKLDKLVKGSRATLASPAPQISPATDNQGNTTLSPHQAETMVKTDRANRGLREHIDSGLTADTLRAPVPINSVISVSDPDGDVISLKRVMFTTPLEDGGVRHYLSPVATDEKATEQAAAVEASYSPNKAVLVPTRTTANAIRASLRAADVNANRAGLIKMVESLIRRQFNIITNNTFTRDSLKFASLENARMAVERHTDGTTTVFADAEHFLDMLTHVVGSTTATNEVAQDFANQDVAETLAKIVMEELTHQLSMVEFEDAEMAASTKETLEVAKISEGVRKLLVEAARWRGHFVGNASTLTDDEILAELSGEGSLQGEALNHELAAVGHELLGIHVARLTSGTSVADMQAASDRWLNTLKGDAKGKPLTKIQAFLKRITEMANRLIAAISRFLEAHRLQGELPTSMAAKAQSLKDIMAKKGWQVPDTMNVQDQYLHAANDTMSHVSQLAKEGWRTAEAQKDLRSTIGGMRATQDSSTFMPVLVDENTGALVVSREANLSKEQVDLLEPKLSILNTAGRMDTVLRTSAMARDLAMVLRNLNSVERKQVEQQLVVGEWFHHGGTLVEQRVQEHIRESIEKASGISADETASAISASISNLLPDDAKFEGMSAVLEEFSVNPEYVMDAVEDAGYNRTRVERAFRRADRIVSRERAARGILEKRAREKSARSQDPDELSRRMQQIHDVMEPRMEEANRKALETMENAARGRNATSLIQRVSNSIGFGLEEQGARQELPHRLMALGEDFDPEGHELASQLVAATDASNEAGRDDEELLARVDALRDRFAEYASRKVREGGKVGTFLSESMGNSVQSITGLRNRQLPFRPIANTTDLIQRFATHPEVVLRSAAEAGMDVRKLEAALNQAIVMKDAVRHLSNFPQELEYLVMGGRWPASMRGTQIPRWTPLNAAFLGKGLKGLPVTLGRAIRPMDARSVRRQMEILRTQGPGFSASLDIPSAEGIIPFTVAPTRSLDDRRVARDKEGNILDVPESALPAVVGNMAVELQDAERASWRLLGLEGGVKPLDPSGVTMDTMKIQERMYQNAIILNDAVTSNLGEQFWRYDPSVTNVTIQTAGYPLREVSREGKIVKLFPKEIIEIPEASFDPAAEGVDRIIGLAASGQIGHLLDSIARFGENMETNKEGYTTPLMTTQLSLAPAGLAYQLIMPPFLKFLALTKGLDIQTHIIAGFPDGKSLFTSYRNLFPGLIDTALFRTERDAIKARPGLLEQRFWELRRMAKVINRIYADSIRTLQDRYAFRQVHSDESASFPLDVSTMNTIAFELARRRQLSESATEFDAPERTRISLVVPTNAQRYIDDINAAEAEEQMLLGRGFDEFGEATTYEPQGGGRGDSQGVIEAQDMNQQAIENQLAKTEKHASRKARVLTTAIMGLFGGSVEAATRFVSLPEFTTIEMEGGGGETEYFPSNMPLDQKWAITGSETVDGITRPVSSLVPDVPDRRFLSEGVPYTASTGLGEPVMKYSHAKIRTAVLEELDKLREEEIIRGVVHDSKSRTYDKAIEEVMFRNMEHEAVFRSLLHSGAIISRTIEPDTNGDLIQFTADNSSVMDFFSRSIQNLAIVNGNASWQGSQDENMPSVVFIPDRQAPMLVFPFGPRVQVDDRHARDALAEMASWASVWGGIDLTGEVERLTATIRNASTAQMQADIRNLITERAEYNFTIPGKDLNEDLDAIISATAEVWGEVVGQGIEKALSEYHGSFDFQNDEVNESNAYLLFADFLTNPALKRALVMSSNRDVDEDVDDSEAAMVGQLIDTARLPQIAGHIMFDQLAQLPDSFRITNSKGPVDPDDDGFKKAAKEHAWAMLDEAAVKMGLNNVSDMVSSSVTPLLEYQSPRAEKALQGIIKAVKPGHVEVQGLVAEDPAPRSLTMMEARQMLAIMDPEDLAAELAPTQDAGWNRPTRPEAVTAQQLLEASAGLAEKLRQKYSRVITHVNNTISAEQAINYGTFSYSDVTEEGALSSDRFLVNRIQKGIVAYAELFGAKRTERVSERSGATLVSYNLEANPQQLERIANEKGVMMFIDTPEGSQNVFEYEKKLYARQVADTKAIMEDIRLESVKRAERWGKTVRAANTIRHMRTSLYGARNNREYLDTLAAGGLVAISKSKLLHTFFTDREDAVNAIAGSIEDSFRDAGGSMEAISVRNLIAGANSPVMNDIVSLSNKMMGEAQAMRDSITQNLETLSTRRESLRANHETTRGGWRASLKDLAWQATLKQDTQRWLQGMEQSIADNTYNFNGIVQHVARHVNSRIANMVDAREYMVGDEPLKEARTKMDRFLSLLDDFGTPGSLVIHAQEAIIETAIRESNFHDFSGGVNSIMSNLNRDSMATDGSDSISEGRVPIPPEAMSAIRAAFSLPPGQRMEAITDAVRRNLFPAEETMRDATRVLMSTIAERARSIEDIGTAQGIMDAFSIAEENETLANLNSLDRSQVVMDVVDSLNRGLIHESGIGLDRVLREQALIRAKVAERKSKVYAFRENQPNTLYINGHPDDVAITRRILSHLGGIWSNIQQDQIGKSGLLAGWDDANEASLAADKLIEMGVSALSTASRMDYQVSSTVLEPGDMSAAYKGIQGAYGDKSLRRFEGGYLEPQDINERLKAIADRKGLTVEQVKPMMLGSSIPQVDNSAPVVKKTDEAMQSLHHAGLFGNVDQKAADAAGDFDPRKAVSYRARNGLQYLASLHASGELRGKGDTLMEDGTMSGDLHQRIETLFKELAVTKPPPHVVGSIVPLVNQAMAEVIADKSIDILAAGYINDRFLTRRTVKFLMHHDAKVRSVFARDIQAQNIAHDAISILESGLDGRTGREGKTAMTNHYAELFREAAAKIGKEEKFEKMSEGYIYSATHSYIMSGDSRFIPERAATLLRMWDRGDDGYRAAVMRGLPDDLPMFPTVLESATASAEVFSRRIAEYLNSPIYKLLEERAVFTKLKEQFAPYLTRLSAGSDVASTMSEMKKSIHPESAAYSDFLMRTFAHVNKALVDQMALDGMDVSKMATKPVVPFSFRGFDMQTHPSDAPRTAGDVSRLEESAWLAGPTQQGGHPIAIMHINGGEAPMSIIKDSLFRINVSPAYKSFEALAGTVAVVDNHSLVVKDGRVGRLESLAVERTKLESSAAVSAARSVALLGQDIMDKDLAPSAPNSRAMSMVQRLQQQGSVGALISLKQIYGQQLPGIMAYSALYNGINKTFLPIYTTYLTSLTVGELDLTPDKEAVFKREFANNVDNMVLRLAPHVYVKTANGESLFHDEMGGIRPSRENRPLGPVTGTARPYTDLLFRPAMAIPKGLETVSSAMLHGVLAAPESVLARSIFIDMVLKGVNDRHVAAGLPVIGKYQLVDPSMDWNITPDITQAAVTTVTDIMAGSDTSKKGSLQQQADTVSGEFARNFLVMLANHNLFTAANSRAGWRMFRHGKDKATKLKGIGLVSASMGQNASYQLLKYKYFIGLASFLMGALAGWDEDRKRRWEESMFDIRPGEDPETRRGRLSFWVNLALRGDARPMGMGKKGWSQQQMDREWRNMATMLSKEAIGQGPSALGGVMATSIGSMMGRGLLSATVGKAVAKGGDPSFDQAGIVLEDEQGNMGMGPNSDKWLDRLVFGASEAFFNDMADQSTATMGLESLLNPVADTSQTNKELDAVDQAIIWGSSFPAMPREYRNELADWFRERTGAKTFLNQWKGR